MEIPVGKEPTRYTLDELSTPREEYLETLQDWHQDEMYTTDQGFARGPTEEFLTWLRDRESTAVSKP